MISLQHSKQFKGWTHFINYFKTGNWDQPYKSKSRNAKDEDFELLEEVEEDAAIDLPEEEFELVSANTDNLRTTPI